MLSNALSKVTSEANGTLRMWQKLEGKPAGKWLFSRLVCFKAPYFGSIRPRFKALRPEYCEVTMQKRWSVQNHLGTVHAIAMCNMAEVAGGIMTEVTVPPTHRWIPKGMTVEYLKKAGTDLLAIATPVSPPNWDQPGEYKVQVKVQDLAGTDVFAAVITMWVSPKNQNRPKN